LRPSAMDRRSHVGGEHNGPGGADPPGSESCLLTLSRY
jgi:hypothetical protein